MTRKWRVGDRFAWDNDSHPKILYFVITKIYKDEPIVCIKDILDKDEYEWNLKWLEYPDVTYLTEEEFMLRILSQ